MLHTDVRCMGLQGLVSRLQVCLAVMVLLYLKSPAQEGLGLQKAALPLQQLSHIGQCNGNLRVVWTKPLLPAM